MIVLDASALIAILRPGDALYAQAAASLLALEGRQLLISPVTHAEVLVGPARVGTLERTRAAIERLGVDEVALAPDAAPRLARIRVDSRLKLPDCCVVLAAQQRAAAVLTFDDRLAAACERLGVPLAGAGSER